MIEKLTDIQNRIVSHGVVKASQLLANPWNYRRHGKAQRAALRGSLATLGWIRSALVNVTTDHMLDGHMRVEESLEDDLDVPVEYVELSEEEEKLALAILDPMTGMAEEDAAQLAALRAAVETEDEALRALVKGTQEPPEPQGTEPKLCFRFAVQGPLDKAEEVAAKLRYMAEEIQGVEVRVTKQQKRKGKRS